MKKNGTWHVFGMKPALQFRLSQSLALTPQLQQAIRLLQLSQMELELELNTALESNPLLEMADSDADGEGEAAAEPVTEVVTSPAETETPTNESPAETVENDDRPLDLESDRSEYRNTALDEDGLEPQDAEIEDLRDHLLWQLNLTPMSSRDRAIAAAIIEAVDDDGYLAESEEALRDALAPLYAVSTEEIESVRRRVQQFDPVGVASCNLR